MARYSKELKHKIMQRIMPPNNESVSQIARNSGRRKPERTVEFSQVVKKNQRNGVQGTSSPLL